MSHVPSHVLVILDEAYFDLRECVKIIQTQWIIDMIMLSHSGLFLKPMEFPE